MENKNILGAKEIAEEMGVGLNFVYRQLKAGKIPARRVGDRYFLSRKAFEEWLAGEQNKVGNC